MSMFNFFIISLQRLAVKDPPQSELTTEGMPKKANHPLRKAVPASEAEASDNGMQ